MSNYKLETKSAIVKPPPSFSDTVTLRVKKQSFGKSKSSGNDQITLLTEIVKPDDVELDGVKYVLSGQEITFYLGLSDELKGKAKASQLAKTQEFHQKLGLPLELDTDNLPYEGLCFEFWGKTRERVMQRRTKEGGFEPILDANGKPQSLGWEWSNNLEDVIGPSTLQTNEGF